VRWVRDHPAAVTWVCGGLLVAVITASEVQDLLGTIFAAWIGVIGVVNAVLSVHRKNQLKRDQAEELLRYPPPRRRDRGSASS
jgi:hypothetical protein